MMRISSLLPVMLVLLIAGCAKDEKADSRRVESMPMEKFEDKWDEEVDLTQSEPPIESGDEFPEATAPGMEDEPGSPDEFGGPDEMEHYRRGQEERRMAEEAQQREEGASRRHAAEEAERREQAVPRVGGSPRREEGQMGRHRSFGGLESTDPKDYTSVRVFYGTDRAATGDEKPDKFFGASRGSKTSLGFCNVSIPKKHEQGELESPKIWKFEFREDPKKHVVLLSIESTNGLKFLTELQKSIQQSISTTTVNGQKHEVGGEAFVFVHGYNVTFEDAARRTAQIAYDLNFQGAPIMYSWPSKGRGTLSAYKADGRAAAWCEENVTEFVTAIALESGARKLHLVAHSMGNRIVSNALRRLAHIQGEEEPPLFNEVILSAPDIDAKTFKESIAPRIIASAERITIYASSNDVALKASNLVHTFDGARLGQGGQKLTTFPEYEQIDVVDASAVDTSLFAFGHSYHADSESVLSDIRLVLGGESADRRGLATIINQVAWKMSPNGRQAKKRKPGLLSR
jgi:esterase/lipase superfamily enzyme